MYCKGNSSVAFTTLRWTTRIEDYLNRRTQYVYYKDCRSPAMNVTCGIPQRSILGLGPLLFLLCIHDLSMTSSISKFILFADCTDVYLSDSSLDQLFHIANKDFAVIADWFMINSLSLNIEKLTIFYSVPQKKSRLLLQLCTLTVCLSHRSARQSSFLSSSTSTLQKEESLISNL